jgi:hypothetical protein
MLPIQLASWGQVRHIIPIDTWAGRLAASLPIGPRTQDSSNFDHGLDACIHTLGMASDLTQLKEFP